MKYGEQIGDYYISRDGTQSLWAVRRIGAEMPVCYCNTESEARTIVKQHQRADKRLAAK